jgi:hypothetical protein
MNLLDTVWESSESEINQTLATIYSGSEDITDKKLFLSKYYVSKDLISQKDIEILSIPEFKQLIKIGDLSFKDIKRKLSLNLDLADVFDEINLSSIATEFLDNRDIDYVDHLQFQYDDYNDKAISFNQYIEVKDFLSKHPEYNNIGLIIIECHHKDGFVDDKVMDLKTMNQKTHNEFKDLNVVVITATKPGKYKDYCTDNGAFKIISTLIQDEQLYGDGLMAFRESNIESIYKIMFALDKLGIKKSEPKFMKYLTWYSYTDFITNEEKYIVTVEYNR